MIDLIMRCTQCDLAYAGTQKRIVAGCREYVRMVFQLCPDWLALDSVAANFKRHGSEETVSAAVVDGACMVPHDVIEAPGFTAWIIGHDADGVRIVSDTVAFTVTPGDAEPGAGSGEPVATVYELCLQAAQDAAASAEAAAAANYSHEWNGTVLTITSTSGTSSADLAGPRGEQGPEGPAGPAGEGIPTGGTAGQVLTKTADGTAWQDAPESGITGTVAIAQGGTGATTAAAARSNLGALSNAAGAVGTSNLASNAVTTAKIAAGSVTADKLADGVFTDAANVTTYKADGITAWKNAYGVVTVQISKAFTSLAQWGTVEIGTLPEGYRPLGQMEHGCYNYTNSGDTAISFRVNTDGTVQAVPYHDGGAGTFTTFFTFIAAV